MSSEITVYQHLTPEQAAIAKAAAERIKARSVAVLAENGKALREAKETLSPARFKALHECAVQVRAATQRIHLRTAVAVIENGRDLLAVRKMPEMKGRFVAWLKAEFNLSKSTAYNTM